ncbi:hypothetical protein M3685_15945 [Heyndrickxia oleronia]|uniref:hypothetical protein n=1 Tax=Heyndrickxia oleronia TaxID=38875 RepID=UPI00203D7B3D|nr:hypothetical protein [Heyndrickxia oleronia]MCM3455417.1 hypothetical protein [Heyndrickxia oleronia]
MAKFRHVQISFWQDPKVLEEMTPEDKYFYIYLLTNPNTTQIGVYQVTKKQIMFEIGYSIESVNSLIERFQNMHKLIKYNPNTREIAILNWGKYNLIKGGKPILDCVQKELNEVKDVSLLSDMVDKIPNESIRQLFYNRIEQKNNIITNDTLHDTLDDTPTISGQKEKEKEKENNIYSNEFEQFWILYPRKIDKKKAYKSFIKILKAYSLDVILSGTEKYSKQVTGVEKKFIKHPSTFLNNESFIDGYEELEEPKQKINTNIPSEFVYDPNAGEDW